MTSLDFEASLKHTFLLLHVVFIAGAAGYIYLKQYDFAIFFGLSSIASLLYYVMYQNKAVLTRLQAHLNLIDQAITDSEEFRAGVKQKSEADEDAVTINLKDVLADKKTSAAQRFIEDRLEKEDFGEYGDARSFLEAVKDAEEEGLDRLGIKHFATEKILEIVEGTNDKQ